MLSLTFRLRKTFQVTIIMTYYWRRDTISKRFPTVPSSELRVIRGDCAVLLGQRLNRMVYSAGAKEHRGLLRSHGTRVGLSLTRCKVEHTKILSFQKQGSFLSASSASDLVCKIPASRCVGCRCSIALWQNANGC